MDIILESHSENWGILYVPRKPEQLYAWHIRWRPSQPCEPRKAVTFNKHLRCSILWIFVIKTLPIKASALYWELQGEANWSSVKLNMFHEQEVIPPLTFVKNTPIWKRRGISQKCLKSMEHGMRLEHFLYDSLLLGDPEIQTLSKWLGFWWSSMFIMAKSLQMTNDEFFPKIPPLF